MKRFARAFAALFVVSLAFVLVACGSGSGSGDAVPANPGNVYRVIALDESGAPVEGVAIQFCSDVMCYTGETDAQGIATFKADEGSYVVHVKRVPEGFAEDATEYEAPQTFGDVTITLKAA